MKKLINEDYRNWFKSQKIKPFYILAINDKSNLQRASIGLQRVFKNDDAFLKEFDFMAFDLPINVADWNNDDWEGIADFVSDCYSEIAETKQFQKNPQSINPIDF